VPKYDFNWQITYELAKPKLLPKGTKLEVSRTSTIRPATVQPDATKECAGAIRRGRDDDRFYSTIAPPAATAANASA